LSSDTIKYEQIGQIEKGFLTIDHNIDLKGNICILPEGVTLYQKGGIIRNGILIGNNTGIKTKGAIFDDVTIRGSWNVPDISSKLFKNLSEDNALRNVMALSNPKVQNKITIENGIYKVVAIKGDSTCLSVCSNTDMIINGTIELKANDLKEYNIIEVKGESIRIKGKGTIIGDKHTHTGKRGEWGMGIRFHQANNASVTGLTIKDCWGDCIYVGGNSKNILIENCKLDHGRRQGISVTKANGVTIRKCTITNVNGTKPQYAIDIEPNRPDSVDNILIEKVTVKDCEGGFLVYKGKRNKAAKTPWIGCVTIRNCSVSGRNKFPVGIKRGGKVRIEDSNIYTKTGRAAISVTETESALVMNNTIRAENSVLEYAKSHGK